MTEVICECRFTAYSCSYPTGLTTSYHLVIAGSLLQSLSLFMLSFAKPNQYYQVTSRVVPCIVVSLDVDILYPWGRFRYRSRSDVYPERSCHIPPFPTETHAGYDVCYLRLVVGCYCPSDYAQLPPQRSCRLCQWRPCERRVGQRFPFNCMSMHANSH